VDITQSPNLSAPQSVHAVVVYDPRTGVIVHRHLTVRYPGGARMEPAALEARALELAAARGLVVSKLRVLQVDPEVFSEPVEHRVDVKLLKLVVARPLPGTVAELVRRPRQAGS
jgi:hypothetical protein